MGAGKVTDCGNVTKGFEPQVVAGATGGAVSQSPTYCPIVLGVAPEMASPEPLHAPTPVSGLENCPVMLEWDDRLAFPLEPTLPPYPCVLTVPPDAVVES